MLNNIIYYLRFVINKLKSTNKTSVTQTTPKWKIIVGNSRQFIESECRNTRQDNNDNNNNNNNDDNNDNNNDNNISAASTTIITNSELL